MNAFVQGFGDELEKLAEKDEKPSLLRGAGTGAAIGGGIGGLAGGALGTGLGELAAQGFRNVDDIVRGVPGGLPMKIPLSKRLIAALVPAAAIGAPLALLGAGAGVGIQGIRRALRKDQKKTAGLVSGVAKGVLGGAGKFVVKHPMLSIFGLYPAARAASSAYGGRVAAAPARVLAAKPGQPSAYHDVNFHELFPHQLPPWQKRRLSMNYPAWRSRIGVTK